MVVSSYVYVILSNEPDNPLTIEEDAVNNANLESTLSTVIPLVVWGLSIFIWFIWFVQVFVRSRRSLKKLPYLPTRARQLAFRFFQSQTQHKV